MSPCAKNYTAIKAIKAILFDGGQGEERQSAWWASMPLRLRIGLTSAASLPPSISSIRWQSLTLGEREALLLTFKEIRSWPDYPA